MNANQTKQNISFSSTAMNFGTDGKSLPEAWAASGIPSVGFNTTQTALQSVSAAEYKKIAATTPIYPDIETGDINIKGKRSDAEITIDKSQNSYRIKFSVSLPDFVDSNIEPIIVMGLTQTVQVQDLNTLCPNVVVLNIGFLENKCAIYNDVVVVYEIDVCAQAAPDVVVDYFYLQFDDTVPVFEHIPGGPGDKTKSPFDTILVKTKRGTVVHVAVGGDS